MSPLRIAVLMGGPSAEREVSLRSGQAVVQALQSVVAHVEPVVVDGSEFALPADVDVAFLALHGTFGEDGQIQRLLDDRGVTYTGSDAEASARSFDKIVAKECFVDAGIPTPRYGGVARFPVVVKPSRQGSSVGITIVRDRQSLEEACAKARQFDEQILIEEFIPGRELTVGVLGKRELPVIEIQTSSGFFGYREKYTPGAADEIVPAPLETGVAVKAQRFARLAHERLGCRDFSRVDLMLSARGELFVLEVNTLPGLTTNSLLPKAAKAAGIEMPELCLQMVELAWARRATEVAA
jgi:D-alanine-D-alanine ligase